MELSRRRKVIRITPGGKLGNQMFQYMAARSLQIKVPLSLVDGYQMPDWNLVCRHNVDLPARYRKLVRHETNMEDVAYALNNDVIDGVVLEGQFQRLQNLQHRDLLQSMFIPPNGGRHGFGEDVLLINVRGSEILRASHVDYRPVPLAFYDFLIAREGLRPVFIGQLGSDWYSDALRQRYSDCEFIPSQGAINDFETIRGSKNIVISVSTFSWIAAWLSCTAQRIHVPLLGFLNPAQRIDMDLLPVNDPRYIFYFFEKEYWKATEEQIKATTSSSVQFREIDHDEAATLKSIIQ